MLDTPARPTDPDAGGRRAPTLWGGREPLVLIAAGLLLAAAGLSVVALFPHYYAGVRGLYHQADQLVPVLIVAAAWLAAAAAVADRNVTRLHAGAFGAAGVAVTEAGLRVADIGPLTGTARGAPGLWLLTGAWAAGLLGALAALAAARRADAVTLVAPPRLSAPASSAGISPGAVAVGAALLAGVAFLPAWDHYIVTSAIDPNFRAGFDLGDAFTNPGLVIAGNVLTAAAIALIPGVALLLRPRRAGAALTAGVLAVVVAQVVAAVVQTLETPDPNQVLASLSPAQLNTLANVGPILSLHLTGWFDAEVAGLLVLLVLTARRTDPTAEVGDPGGHGWPAPQPGPSWPAGPGPAWPAGGPGSAWPAGSGPAWPAGGPGPSWPPGPSSPADGGHARAAVPGRERAR